MTDFRIIYVPGMKPKPKPELHRHELLRCLLAGMTRVRPRAATLLDLHRERFELVSWTYLFYGSYRDIEIDLAGIERLLAHPNPSREDLEDIDSVQRRLRRLWLLFGDSLPWLSRFVAQPDMRVTMTEVRRYHSDKDGIGGSVRRLLKSELLRAWEAGEKVMLIGHSLGSVISYDSLWELSHEDGAQGRVDLFVTLGSPLATRFIRNSLRGANVSGRDRYPANIRAWVNYAAKGEMTAVYPRLAPFFGDIVKLRLTESFEDHPNIYNHFHADFGINVHKSYGYLAHGAVASRVGKWLESIA